MTVLTAKNGCEVVIGRGLLPRAGELVLALPCSVQAEKCAVIADENCRAYADEVCTSLESSGFAVHLMTITAGEHEKNFSLVEKICEFLAISRIERTDLLCAVGGGVTGDVAGFAAACYMRGISFIQIPTTVLAQNDAAIGGKTAVNLPQGKNLAGAFHPPALVICDVDTLGTLPEREMRSGLAEVIKHGAIRSAELFTRLENEDFSEHAEELTAVSAAVKLDIVGRDERESGERKLLNFGHTIGHAAETASDYAYTHGEAVAFGMLAAARAGEFFGVTQNGAAARLRTIIKKYGFPDLKALSRERLLQAMLSDKKAHSDKLDFIMLKRLGEAFIHTVPLGDAGLLLDAGLCVSYAVCRRSEIIGTVKAPPSKSELQRAVICAALADGISEISPYDGGDDVQRCIAAVQSLGADVAIENGALHITGIAQPPVSCVIDCGSSATLLRLLIPVCAALGVNTHFKCSEQLLARPLDEYFRLLPEHGVHILRRNGGVEIYGRLTGGNFEVGCETSSQFLSGMMHARPLCGGSVRPSGEVCSRPYADMTADMLRRFGITAPTGKQRCSPAKIAISGDWSQSAFMLAAGALSGSVTVTGLDIDSTQGDRAIVGILRRMGARVEITENSVSVTAGALSAADIDVTDTPDLAPVLMVLGCAANGVTRLRSTGRLKHKESDRANEAARQLRRLGADIVCNDDSVEITGTRLSGGYVSACGDHRMAMALTCAALLCDEPVKIAGAECVSKSWNEFFEIFRSVGGIADVVNMG